MMPHLPGLSPDLWITLLVLVLPTALRQWPRIKSAFVSQPPGSLAPTQNGPLVLAQDWFFWLWPIAYNLLLLLVYNPGFQNPFTITGSPIVVAADLLDRHVVDAYRGVPPEAQLRLLARLTTLDNRLHYAALGRSSLVNCSWCQQPIDHRLYSAVLIATSYLVMACAVGRLTTCSMGRQRWRTWTCCALALGLLGECTILVYSRPRILPSGHGDMVWDRHHLVRHLAFLALELALWLAPSPIPSSDPAACLGQTKTAIARLADSLQYRVDSVRLMGVQRGAIMRHPASRAKISTFWSATQSRADAAHRDDAVQKLQGTCGVDRRGPERARLRSMIQALTNGEGNVG